MTTKEKLLKLAGHEFASAASNLLIEDICILVRDDEFANSAVNKLSKTEY